MLNLFKKRIEAVAHINNDYLVSVSKYSQNDWIQFMYFLGKIPGFDNYLIYKSIGGDERKMNLYKDYIIDSNERIRSYLTREYDNVDLDKKIYIGIASTEFLNDVRLLGGLIKSYSHYKYQSENVKQTFCKIYDNLAAPKVYIENLKLF